jgi:pyruvate-ferredoxin/flavodoxin oxidoreductase
MRQVEWKSMDGNAAAAHSAHAMSEVVAIYPITPSSPMAEAADEYSAAGKANIFGTVPTVYEMQSEGGAVAAIHGAMASGALTTTFTASQGLLLMIPSMYKIAGEMMPSVFNITARTISSHALSIFGDHSDVMACRQTGFAMLASCNQQECMDQAAIAMAASIRASLPFMHFFDGFRTSHEISKVQTLSDEIMLKLVDQDALLRFRNRALNPDKPILKGTAMNPDIWFQGAEARNPHHKALPGLLSQVFDEFAALTGRQYKLFEYHGDPQAETLLVAMGSGSEVVAEAVDYLNANGYKVGLVNVRLYRPFVTEAFLAVLPKTVKQVAVLDRTKEPGSAGEPLYQDVVTAFDAGRRLGLVDHAPLIIGGRYGLSSKEFTPSHVKAVVDHLTKNEPKNWIHGFTVGIDDDVSHTSLKVEEIIDTEPKGVHRLKFWGLGSDGTVGANKNSIKIIGDYSDMWVQGHFVYDSKKAGGTTISHLRFSKQPIRSHYLIDKPDFVAIHNREFLGKYELLAGLRQGGMVLINTDLPHNQVFASFPEREQKIMIDKKARLFAIDANAVAAGLGMPGRINTTMQAAFFNITQILPMETVLNAVKKAIQKSYGKKGEKVVELNVKAFTTGLDSYTEIPIPATVGSERSLDAAMTVLDSDKANAAIITGVIDPISHLDGDNIPVSKIPVDGVFPTGTTRYEKRSIATHVPKWDESLCIQCGYCAFACPHAAVRTRIHAKDQIQLSAGQYVTIPAKGKEATDNDGFRVQVFPDDCTGCGVCIEVCMGKDKESGAKALKLVPKHEVLDDLRTTLAEFLRLPPTAEKFVNKKTVKGVQLADPLFEFSGACPGCGETPYIKLATQLVGDHMIQANATGCSSIYGGTAPTVPYSRNPEGRGPAWASSLFEDNAEYGLGMRLGVEYLQSQAFALREQVLADAATSADVKSALNDIAPLAAQADEAVYKTSKDAAERVRALLANAPANSAHARLRDLASYLTEITIFIVGGDGWAYDIGYGGLDHVLASGKNVNVLVLDTEVYSNTGGQRSKSTFMGGVAKFAAAGKDINKKDLGMMAMNYRSVYVASVNFSANMPHTVKAMREAIEYPGTSLIIGWSTCIEHGIRMNQGPSFGKLAVDTGYWLLYRYDPRLLEQKKNPLQLDSGAPSAELRDFLKGERRFARLMDERPERAEQLFAEAGRFIINRYGYYKQLSEMNYDTWLTRER